MCGNACRSERRLVVGRTTETTGRRGGTPRVVGRHLLRLVTLLPAEATLLSLGLLLRRRLVTLLLLPAETALHLLGRGLRLLRLAAAEVSAATETAALTGFTVDGRGSELQ